MISVQNEVNTRSYTFSFSYLTAQLSPTKRKSLSVVATGGAAGTNAARKKSLVPADDRLATMVSHSTDAILPGK